MATYEPSIALQIHIFDSLGALRLLHTLTIPAEIAAVHATPLAPSAAAVAPSSAPLTITLNTKLTSYTDVAPAGALSTAASDDVASADDPASSPRFLSPNSSHTPAASPVSYQAREEKAREKPNAYRNVLSLEWSQSSRLLIVTTGVGLILVWDVERACCLRVLR
jgi:hypothetical protein